MILLIEDENKPPHNLKKKKRRWKEAMDYNRLQLKKTKCKHTLPMRRHNIGAPLKTFFFNV